MGDMSAIKSIAKVSAAVAAKVVQAQGKLHVSRQQLKKKGKAKQRKLLRNHVKHLKRKIAKMAAHAAATVAITTIITAGSTVRQALNVAHEAVALVHHGKAISRTFKTSLRKQAKQLYKANRPQWLYSTNRAPPQLRRRRTWIGRMFHAWESDPNILIKKHAERRRRRQSRQHIDVLHPNYDHFKKRRYEVRKVQLLRTEAKKVQPTTILKKAADEMRRLKQARTRTAQLILTLEKNVKELEWRHEQVTSLHPKNEEAAWQKDIGHVAHKFHHHEQYKQHKQASHLDAESEESSWQRDLGHKSQTQWKLPSNQLPG